MERWSCGSAPPIRAIEAHLISAPIFFVASSPSKGRPKDGFPKRDAESQSWRAALREFMARWSLAEGPWDLLWGGPHEGAVRVPGRRHIYDPFGARSLTLFLAFHYPALQSGEERKGIEL